MYTSQQQAMKKTYMLFALALFLLIHARAQDFDTVQIKTVKITDAIYMLEGAGGNIGLCVGPDGAFLIDNQYAPLTGKIKDAIAGITGKPVQFVINTHFHHDHVGGNENFGKEGAIIVSQDNTRERIEADQLQRLASEKQQGLPAESLPMVTFSGSMTFYYNNDTIHAFHVSHAHTDGDIIIHFRQANVFHMGDVFVRYGFPFIDVANGGNINGMIRGLERAMEMADEDSQFIPGHGKLAGLEDVVRFHHMLKTIRDSILSMREEGMSLEDVMDANPIEGFGPMNAGARSFIEVVYEGVFFDW
jgi:cyclase